MATSLDLIARLLLQDQQFVAGLKRASRESSGFAGRMQQMGRRASETGGMLTRNLSLPIAGVAIAAFKAASDLNEAQSKSDTVFGRSAKEINDWAQDSATAFGMARSQALDMAGTLGNLFLALKLPEREAVKMSKSIIELAADLASFNNTSTDDALQALRAGLVGETEPLKRFGVNLNEATLKQKALDLGLIRSAKGTLPAAVKAQAAYALILEQTTKAQGDFQRTSDGAANKTRILKAQFTDAAATLGTQLLPHGQRLLTWASDLVTRFNGLSHETQGFALKAGALALALGPVLRVGGNAAQGIGTLARNVGDASRVMRRVDHTPISLLGKAVSLVKAHPLIALGAAAVGAGVGLFMVGRNAGDAKKRLDDFRGVVAGTRRALDALEDAALGKRFADLAVREAAAGVKDAKRALREARKGGNEREVAAAELVLQRAHLTHAQALKEAHRAQDALTESRKRAQQERSVERGKIMAEVAVLKELHNTWIAAGSVDVPRLNQAVGVFAAKVANSSLQSQGLVNILKNLPKEIRTRVRARLIIETAIRIARSGRPNAGAAAKAERMALDVSVSGPRRPRSEGSVPWPRFHQGGVFRAASPGGEGLAILRDRERVLTEAQDRARGGGSDQALAAAIAMAVGRELRGARWQIDSAGFVRLVSGAIGREAAMTARTA